MDAASLTQALPAQAANASSATGKPGVASKAEGFDKALKQVQSSADETKKDTEATPEGLIAQATVLDLVLNSLPKQSNAQLSVGTTDGKATVDPKVIAANLPAVTQAFGEVWGSQGTGNDSTNAAKATALVAGQDAGTTPQSSLTGQRPGQLQLSDDQAQQIAELLSQPDLNPQDVKDKTLAILGDDVCYAEPKQPMPKCGTQSDFPNGDALTNSLNGKGNTGGPVVNLQGANIQPVNAAGQTTEPKFTVIHEHKDRGSWDVSATQGKGGSVTVASSTATVVASGTTQATDSQSALSQALTAMKAELVDSASQLTATNAPAPQVSGDTLAAIVQKGRSQTVVSKLDATTTTASQAAVSLVNDGTHRSKQVLGSQPPASVSTKAVVSDAAKVVDASTVKADSQTTAQSTVKSDSQTVASASNSMTMVDPKSVKSEPTSSKDALRGQIQSEPDQLTIKSQPDLLSTSLKTVRGVGKDDDKDSKLDAEDIFGKAAHAVVHQTVTKADAKLTVDAPKPLLDAKVMQETVDKITDMVAANRPGTVTLKLHPEDLGTVDVTVKQAGNRTDVQVAASDDRVRMSLQAHRTDLMQSLQSKGVEVGTVNLATGHGDMNPGHSQQQSSQATRQEFEQSANLRAFSTPAPVSVPQGTLTFGPTTTVDYTA